MYNYMREGKYMRKCKYMRRCKYMRKSENTVSYVMTFLLQQTVVWDRFILWIPTYLTMDTTQHTAVKRFTKTSK